MARITKFYKNEATDQRSHVRQNLSGKHVMAAQASQVGRGVRIQVPLGIVINRLNWEIFKGMVEKAFRDDEDISIEDPLW